MFYQFCEDVYLVVGHQNSCIYDLKQGKLYLLNGELTEKFILLNDGILRDDIDDSELKNCLEYFMANDVVTLSEVHVRRDINDIADRYSEITFAWIEVTNQCNLRCKHCYNESDAECDKKMTFEQFRLVVDCLVTKGIKRIQIIGGEPFWNQKRLLEELNYVVGKFEQIEIFTNGTLITNEWFEYLAQNRICIALSVYSYDKNEHDKVTGIKGSWEMTNDTINKLKSYNIKYRVCNVLMKDLDIQEANTELYKLSRDKDIVRMTGRGNFGLLSDELIRKRLITKQTFEDKFSLSFCKRMVSGHNCFNTRIYIAADLDVYPCVMERRFRHCNIAECQELLLDDSIRMLGKDAIEECKECEFRYACFDCRPNSLSGEKYEKPWYCTYNPYDGIWEDEEKFIKELKEKWG